MTTEYVATIRVRIPAQEKAWAEQRAKEVVTWMRCSTCDAELVSVEPAEPVGRGEKP